LAGRAFIVDARGGLEDLLQNEQRKLPRPVRERVRRPTAKRLSYLCTARGGRNRRRGLVARQRRTHRNYALPNAGSSSARMKGERRYTDSFILPCGGWLPCDFTCLDGVGDELIRTALRRARSSQAG
ncbi:unnamed protein product, partial [Scytosiphon promiscuus]